MRIIVYACIWQRPQITTLFSFGYERLKKDFGAGIITCTSTSEDFEHAQKLGLNPVNFTNTPVGAKHNYGMIQALKDKSWDAVLVMNSDGLISSEGVQKLISMHRSHVGFHEFIAVESQSGMVVRNTFPSGGKIVGSGRLISRDAVEICLNRAMYSKRKGQQSTEMALPGAKYLQSRSGGYIEPVKGYLWEDSRNRDLDESADIRLSSLGFAPVGITDHRVHVLDVKSAVNINGMGNLSVSESKMSAAPDDWDWFLSDNERLYLSTLKQ